MHAGSAQFQGSQDQNPERDREILGHSLGLLGEQGACLFQALTYPKAHTLTEQGLEEPVALPGRGAGCRDGAASAASGGR